MPAVDAIIGLLAGAGIAWIWRAEARRHRGHELRHPKLLLLVASGMLPCVWFVHAAASRGAVDWVGLAVPLCCAAAGAYLLLEYWTVRYLVHPDGFGYQTLFAGTGFAAWGDIRSVQWSLLGSWFRVELRSGRVVRISAIVLGLPALAQALLDQCGPAIDPLARPALEQAAVGRPPLPW